MHGQKQEETSRDLLVPFFLVPQGIPRSARLKLISANRIKEPGRENRVIQVSTLALWMLETSSEIGYVVINKSYRNF